MRKLKKHHLLYLFAASPLVFGIVTASTLAIYVKDAESLGSYGVIDLRSYFEKGSGDSEDDPYVITRPMHLYNLSRLQNVGAFKTKKYFRLGVENLEGDGEEGQYLVYAADTGDETSPFLDMKKSKYDYEPITAIGSEATPFYGEFDGENVEIKNLKVFADPQDAGLFGYTAQGSLVHNLFLTDVTINTMGYTSAYNGLYGESETASLGAEMHYSRLGLATPIDFNKSSSDSDSYTFDAAQYFAWKDSSSSSSEASSEPSMTEETSASSSSPGKPLLPTNAVEVTLNAPKNNFSYQLLVSGGIIDLNADKNKAFLNLEKLYDFFYDQKDKSTTAFPLLASSSISLAASALDDYGLGHSKVIMSLELSFVLESKDSTEITMDVNLGKDHSNNIGFIIGHCDGSVTDCYVHNGTFIMNNGDVVTEAETPTYFPLANSSSYGLIGLFGSSVRNLAAQESESATQEGKDAGVLDFTNIYDNIIGDTSFGNETFESGVKYTPNSNTKYRDFLRYSYGDYVSIRKDAVSLRCQKILKDDEEKGINELGVFTVATHYTGTGTDSQASTDWDKSVIAKEDVSSTIEGAKSYFAYYATGEYQKTSKVSFSSYTSSFNTDNPGMFHVGHHFPQRGQVTWQSFEQREMYHNYFVRFKLDPGYRTNKGLYFSDVDLNTDGGSFLSNYFYYKLVDEDNQRIGSVDKNNDRRGVMLRSAAGNEIRKFSANFETPDLSTSATKIYCINDGDVYPAANMVNFEISRDEENQERFANVTVIAAPSDISKPAALGVYKLSGTPSGSGEAMYYEIKYDNPDYAFFMPKDEQLAYFDYKVGADKKGKIGVYNSDGTDWVTATSATDATLPSTYEFSGSSTPVYTPETSSGPGKEGSIEASNRDEYGYDQGSGKPRLFAHTFCLPSGKYCIGSATGKNGLGTSKIYYVCAQGQDAGTMSFSDNVFYGKDTVENVDFTKVPRFTVQTNGDIDETIEIGTASEYDPTSPLLENQRCYIALNKDARSTFSAAKGVSLSFVYQDGVFSITTNDEDSIESIKLDNYCKIHWPGMSGDDVTAVVLIEGDSKQDPEMEWPTTSGGGT